MLAEGVVEAWPRVTAVPDDLTPTTMFSDEQIRVSLPEPGRFGIRDLRLAR